MVVDHHQPGRVAFQAGAAGQQGAGVVVLRAGEDLRHRPLLADDAVAHHHHVVGHLAHHAQVVADEQHAHAPRGLELTHELQDLALDGDVQRRGGLIGDQQLGLAGQRHGNHHALLLAARHLVRVGGHAPRRLRDAHLGQQFLGTLPGLGLGHAHVLDQRLSQLRTHGEHRVQRGHRVLEDAGDLASAQRLQLGQRSLEQVTPLPQHLTRTLGVVGQQVQDGHGGDALARARLAHQGHDGVLWDVEAHALHRVGALRNAIHAPHAKGDFQVTDAQQHGRFSSAAAVHKVRRNRTRLIPAPATSGPARRAPRRPSARTR